MTPTLARMVAARANALPRPIKWFSIPRMCRAEKPQRGRLREFFQWNVDILGVDDVLADAEVIAAAIEFVRQAGLTPADVVMRISSRPLAGAALTALGIAADQVGRGFELIDRYEKLGPEEFERRWRDYAPGTPCEAVLHYLETADLESCLSRVAAIGDHGVAASAQFESLWERLRALGVADFCKFDLKVVRGLAYYTGPVFELNARKPGLRALLGGGRYDSLTQLLDGPRVPAVGFGMGDAPVLELLAELGKLPQPGPSLDAFAIDADAELLPSLLEIVAALRQAGLACDFSYKRQPIGKQLKQAAARGTRYAVIIGAELRQRNELTVKNLATERQAAVPLATLLASPRATLANI
jgi:histidyl-tRNA synthetase